MNPGEKQHSRGLARHFLPALLVLLLAGAMPAASAPETGYTTLKSTEVKDEPFGDAGTVVTLPEKTVVEIVQRQGAWMKIKAPGNKQGWVRLLSVRLGSPDQKPQSSGSLLSSLGFGGKPQPTGNSQVTTGVRGFSEEDLKKAKPNPAELEKMKGFSSTRDDALKVAESGKLAVREQPYFDENGKAVKEKK